MKNSADPDHILRTLLSDLFEFFVLQILLIFYSFIYIFVCVCVDRSLKCQALFPLKNKKNQFYNMLSLINSLCLRFNIHIL